MISLDLSQDELQHLDDALARGLVAAHADKACSRTPAAEEDAKARIRAYVTLRQRIGAALLPLEPAPGQRTITDELRDSVEQAYGRQALLSLLALRR